MFAESSTFSIHIYFNVFCFSYIEKFFVYNFNKIENLMSSKASQYFKEIVP